MHNPDVWVHRHLIKDFQGARCRSGTGVGAPGGQTPMKNNNNNNQERYLVPQHSALAGTLVIEAGLCLINLRLDGMTGAYASGTRGSTRRPFKPQTHRHNVLWGKKPCRKRRNEQGLSILSPPRPLLPDSDPSKATPAVEMGRLVSMFCHWLICKVSIDLYIAHRKHTSPTWWPLPASRLPVLKVRRASVWGGPKTSLFVPSRQPWIPVDFPSQNKPK